MVRLVAGLVGMAVCWVLTLTVALHLSIFSGSVPGMVVSAVPWWTALVGTVLLGVATRRMWPVWTAAVTTLLLAAPVYNWSGVAPEAWFETHRPLYERAARTAEVDDSFYGSLLPLELRPLAATGKVSRRAGGLFFPLWIGIPDDAGGYFYTPHRSPAGADMYGTVCTDPVDLGDGWWMCGMT